MKAEVSMVHVWINKSQFEYDIHSLVKAFYPGEDVKVGLSGGEGKAEEGRVEGVRSEAAMGEDMQGEAWSKLAGDEEDAWTKPAGSEEDAGANGRSADASDMVKPTDIYIDFHENGITVRIGEKKERKAFYREYAPGAGRPEIKNVLKQQLYQTLSGHLGKTLPWGTLTGIRPTKIPMGMLEEGWAEEEILADMERKYYISREKGKLSIDIAKRERELLSVLHYKDGYSLYIGIPFCPTTCLYCSFTSYPIGLWKKRVGEYLEALEKEMAYVAEVYRDKILDTVYIGGGTPTTLEPEELDRLLTSAGRYFDLSRVQEFTVEAGRADSITREKLQVLKRHKITRISVNPQTMKEETLRIIGRRHSVEQVRTAFWLAREEGFDNINMDIILGLPGETKEDVKYTAEEIRKLRPDSLTVHSLAVKRASGLNRWIEENGISALNNTDATMDIAAKAAKDMGMEPYYLYRQKNMSGNFENVGYALPGRYGVYNILINEEVQTIAALGAGSISKRVYPDGRIERTDNVKDVALYIERIEEMIERKKRLLGDCP